MHKFEESYFAYHDNIFHARINKDKHELEFSKSVQSKDKEK